MNGVHVVEAHVLLGGGLPLLVDGSDGLHGAGVVGHHGAREGEGAGEGDGERLGAGHGVDGAEDGGLGHVHGED